MNEDIYENYKADRYIHYRLVPTGEYEIIPTKRDGKVINIRKPILEKRKVSFEEIKALNLDDFGRDVRTCAEDFTFIHNYLYDYWGAIMGSDAISTYLHLKRYVYGKKDFCFPDMEIIQLKMKKGSKNTIIKAMNTLEEYGFITKILRIDKERHNADSSPFFKLRRYIPLLSEELINQLPEKLRNEHDKFIASTNGIILDESYDSEQIVNQLLEKSSSIKSKNKKERLDELKRQGKLYEFIVSTLSSEQHDNWFLILHELSSKISKPSFETWFSKTIILLDQELKNVKVITANSFNQDWIQERYKLLILQIINDKFYTGMYTQENLKQPFSFECLLFDEYIK
ncbi:MAG: DnaA N-terminal domain-containing protein [Bacillota bacterium]|nr:DnaA N-terminal domain-containing protein [Bacillota bacterium]